MKLYFLICPTDNCVRYVGITSLSLSKRLDSHLWDKEKTNPHKYRWIQKLKKQGLKPIIKEVCSDLTEEQACQMEIDLISVMRYLVRNKLVNIHPGGLIPPGMKGKIHSEETKKRMKEKIITEATRKKLSKSRIGKTPWNKGVITNEQTKKKKSKPVCQFDLRGNLIQEFWGVREASRLTGVDSSGISACCKGKLKTAGKFIWKHK